MGFSRAERANIEAAAFNRVHQGRIVNLRIMRNCNEGSVLIHLERWQRRLATQQPLSFGKRSADAKAVRGSTMVTS